MQSQIQVVTKYKDFLAHMMQPNPNTFYYFRTPEWEEIKPISIPEINNVVIYCDVIDENGAFYLHPSFAPELIQLPHKFKSPIIVNTSAPFSPYPDGQPLDIDNLTRYCLSHRVGLHIPDIVFKWK